MKTTITYDPAAGKYYSTYRKQYFTSEVELMAHILEAIRTLKLEGTEKELIFELKEITK